MPLRFSTYGLALAHCDLHGLPADAIRHDVRWPNDLKPFVVTT